MSKTDQILFRVPEDFKDMVKRDAADRGVSMSQLMMEAVSLIQAQFHADRCEDLKRKHEEYLEDAEALYESGRTAAGKRMYKMAQDVMKDWETALQRGQFYVSSMNACKENAELYRVVESLEHFKGLLNAEPPEHNVEA